VVRRALRVTRAAVWASRFTAISVRCSQAALRANSLQGRLAMPSWLSAHPGQATASQPTAWRTIEAIADDALALTPAVVASHTARVRRLQLFTKDLAQPSLHAP
jgi:hypothetical protein